MREWIEELLLENQQLKQQADLLIRVIAYLDTEPEETPIPLQSLQDIKVPNISVDQEGIRLTYVATIHS
jgi:hypothetical protein